LERGVGGVATRRRWHLVLKFRGGRHCCNVKKSIEVVQGASLRARRSANGFESAAHGVTRPT